jgi:hypothetical protein
MHVGQLIKAIKAHIAKGDHAKDKAEQHYISAGQHLKTLKARHDTDGGNWAEWSELLTGKCDLSTGRASELMQIADGRTSQEKIRAKDKDRKKLGRNKKSSSGHPEEDPPSSSGHPEEDPPGPITDPAGWPATNPLVAMWAKANTETRREFVMTCWDEMLPHSPVVGIRTPLPDLAKPNGNAGANHWAHLSKENTEGIDHWIERTRHDNTARGTTRQNPWSSGEDP